MKKASALILALCMMLTLIPSQVFAAEDKTVDVTTAESLVGFFTETNANPVVYKNLTINIQNDIDLSKVSWVPGFLNGYNGAETYTVNGNGFKLTGLTGPLFRGTWAGSGKLYINDLTIADSEISGGSDNQGFGAFVGHTEATSDIVLKNCHLLNSTLTGADWTGGLIGYAAGYGAQNDGPVFETILIDGCSVKNCEITGKGSTGAIIGHATGNVWTKVTIEDCVVEGNTVKCTDDSDKKAGSVMGTVGVAGAEHAGKTGGVYVNALVKNNKVTSNDVEVSRIYGRFGSNGSLYVTGGKYYDVTSVVNAAAPDSGTYYAESTAIFADHMFDVTVANGTADLTKDILPGTTVTITAIVGENVVFDKWEVVSGGVTLLDATKEKTTFVMGNADVEVNAVLVCTHPVSKIVDKADATCTNVGYTGDEVCGVCGSVLEKGKEIAALGHKFVDGVCVCGLNIKVEAEVTDTVPVKPAESGTSGSTTGTTEKVEVPKVEEVTVVESTETKKAEASVKAEATEIVATTMTEGTDKLVEDKVVDKETAANLEAVTAVMNGDTEAVEKAVEAGLLTKEEVKVIEETVAKGETVVKAEISVSEVKKDEVEKTVQAAIEEKAVKSIAKEAVVAQYLDVTVALKAAGKTLGTIDKLEEPITITVAIPENLKVDNAKYYVIRNHEGEVTLLPTTLNADGTVTFTTDRFSTYALAYAKDAKAPATGDNVSVMPYIVMAVAACAAVVVLKKRESFER